MGWLHYLYYGLLFFAFMDVVILVFICKLMIVVYKSKIPILNYLNKMIYIYKIWKLYNFFLSNFLYIIHAIVLMKYFYNLNHNKKLWNCNNILQKKLYIKSKVEWYKIVLPLYYLCRDFMQKVITNAIQK